MMGRPRKKPIYVIVEAEVLGSISKDRVLDFESEPNEHLLDELQCPLADEVLIALRKAYSLTFPRNPFIDGLQEALNEIRRIGVDALRTVPEVVEELHLKSVPAPTHEKKTSKAYLLKFCFARRTDLQLKVKYEGKTQRLLSMFDERPGDGLVEALRSIISDTFEEMHNEEQHEEVLRCIRQRIGSILPDYNDLLAEIEIEPIAVFQVDDGPEVENESD